MSLRADTEQRILDASVRLFAKRGFSGATTREIARLADLNENTLFRHFPTKQALFWAAVQSCLRDVRIPKELQSGLARGESPQVIVPLIVELLVHTAVRQPELIRLLQVGALEFRSGVEQVFQEQLAPIFRSISDYVRLCVESGTMRQVDPAIAAMSMVATTLGHKGAYYFQGNGAAACGKTEKVIHAYSQFWLGILLPDGRAYAVPRSAGA